MTRILIFCMVSAGFVFISFPSFRNLRTHGFPRFFLWEADLALILINVPVWFDHPLAWNQLLSWVLLAGSIIMVVAGFATLKQMGKAQGHFENTTALVTNGIYRYVRHPMYSSLLLLGWGSFLKDISLPSSLLVALSTVSAIITAKLEELEIREKFGDAYREYKKHTGLFIPYVF